MGLFESAISISVILKIMFFLNRNFLKSYRRLIKHIKNYFFINRMFG